MDRVIILFWIENSQYKVKAKFRFCNSTTLSSASIRVVKKFDRGVEQNYFNHSLHKTETDGEFIFQQLYFIMNRMI
ncbi:hypothetical protein RBB68_12180 [Leptospira interrogans]|uniref:Uncharacterized protein n=1 Tax=Leptospira interrogans serovar Icterohaemorrhagiae TaxID=90062 RepID=A0AAW4JVW1_LEPIR|nr:hypothetical protein [Leptospira interrogans]ARB95143.1 hypothetical protein A6J42_05950 [Leptospira interrogans serovar Copenhageni]KAA5551843.1 hypothetical protein F3G11_05790 [Leptospira interrogans serovar Copenhageni]MBO7986789.1 hypothetical protein [Leptospira interrogans serovar Copenhageni]MBO7990710.1 hypothetical protein [Leptospira interrogans serovar Copenhageni]MBO7994094.1 hypothetical protein [Leptospira interrogans serovar Copenhageni]